MPKFVEVNRVEWLAQLEAFTPNGEAEAEIVATLRRAVSPPENAETVNVLATHVELIQRQTTEE